MPIPPAGNPARVLPPHGMQAGDVPWRGWGNSLYQFPSDSEFPGPTPVVRDPRAAVVTLTRSCREFLPCIKGFTHSHSSVS